MRNFILFFLPFMAFADCKDRTITGKPARELYRALTLFQTPQEGVLRFGRFECAYDGPGAGDDCHSCKNGKNLVTKKTCRSCGSLMPKHPSYCELDGMTRKDKLDVTRPAGRALRAIKTNSSAAMGGWRSELINSGSCTLKKNSYRCTYCLTEDP